MQISKRLGQNIVEFVFVFPLLVLLTFLMLEIGFYWQEVNQVSDLNNEINANAATVDFKELRPGEVCPAAKKSLETMQNKASIISITGSNYDKTLLDGTEPFALYKYVSQKKVDGIPLNTLYVDCRNPYENGVETYLEFYHKTIIMKASLPRFDSPEPIVIIPDKILIKSSKVNTIRHF